MDRRQDWFDRGCEAFKRTAPQLADQIPWERFYVCPLCFTAFNESALTEKLDRKKRLTIEHVPPSSVGGKKMLLTCGGCNSRAGTEVDSHMRREADTHDFMKGNLREVKAHVETDSGSVPIRLSMADFGIKAAGVPKAVRPEVQQSVMGDFEQATIGRGWEDFTFKISLQPYSHPRASASWLRAAYLAFFAALGYRFIFRRELDVVRERIKNPELDTPTTCRILSPDQSEPKLVRIETPVVFRSYAMFYGHNVMFLPRYNDHALYERLAEHPDTNVQINGTHYPWPNDGPTFFHDQAQT
jgi:hypothetical protein